MWGTGQQGNSPERFPRRSSQGSTESSPPEVSAATLAARMAFAYDGAPPAAAAATSSLFDVYGTPSGQPQRRGERETVYNISQHHHQYHRARELELLHLQQQMQERQAYENESRSRLLEHAARNHLQEYERTRMQLELMQEMRQREVRMGTVRDRQRQKAPEKVAVAAQNDDLHTSLGWEREQGGINRSKQPNKGLETRQSCADDLDDFEKTSQSVELWPVSSHSKQPILATNKTNSNNDVHVPVSSKIVANGSSNLPHSDSNPHPTPKEIYELHEKRWDQGPSKRIGDQCDLSSPGTNSISRSRSSTPSNSKLTNLSFTSHAEVASHGKKERLHSNGNSILKGKDNKTTRTLDRHPMAAKKSSRDRIDTSLVQNDERMADPSLETIEDATYSKMSNLSSEEMATPVLPRPTLSHDILNDVNEKHSHSSCENNLEFSLHSETSIPVNKEEGRIIQLEDSSSSATLKKLIKSQKKKHDMMEAPPQLAVVKERIQARDGNVPAADADTRTSSSSQTKSKASKLKKSQRIPAKSNNDDEKHNKYSEATTNTFSSYRNPVNHEPIPLESQHIALAKETNESFKMFQSNVNSGISQMTRYKVNEEDNFNPTKESTPELRFSTVSETEQKPKRRRKKENQLSPSTESFNEAGFTTPNSSQSSQATLKKRKKTPSTRAKESLGLDPDSSASSGGKQKKQKKSSCYLGGKKASLSSLTAMIKRIPGVPSVEDPIPDITDVEYENVEALLSEFCRVPFLAEFSRPVSLLHPELMELYSKIVHYPMDLGHVCRAIRRREYKDARAIQLDVWRIFSNCIKFHSHPSNRENAIPSFISIAMHLREFFNSLWQEYMLPSDAPPRPPGKGISHVHAAFQKRAEARKERLLQVSSTILSIKSLQKAVDFLNSFISSGGKVDMLDKDSILGDESDATGDIATFIASLRGVINCLEGNIRDNQDYSVLMLHRDLKKCYTEDIFENQILKKMHIGSRLDRIFGKILVPVYEAGSRGVNQSSIWGCMAAAIWARESKKKPYWPAIVLGILAPDDQKEDWHQALTERNEARLPEKLREELKTGKRKAELGLKKQNSDLMSYFLVEFMGSHEFIWVRESDIVENFDPEEDVNVASAAGNITKKKRSSASSFSSKAMSNAIEEGRWALEEFELQLNDPCGDLSDDEGDYDIAGYSYEILCQSDDEADELESFLGLEVAEKSQESDIDEQNELLASDGLLDFSTEGRKRAKLRAAAMKKQNAFLLKQERERAKDKDREKEKESKWKKDSSAKKSKVSTSNRINVSVRETKKLEKQLELEEKRELREQELKRRKRAREHDKLLKIAEQTLCNSKANFPEKRINVNEVSNKRDRAEAVSRGFLLRKSEEGDFKSNGFNNSLFTPSATVDPDSLLGMALAFRSAAGEISFGDSTGKPPLAGEWDKIETDTSWRSSERCDCLQEKIGLLEQEILTINLATKQRMAFIESAKTALSNAKKQVLKHETDARASFEKKSKKCLKKIEKSHRPVNTK